MTKNMQEKFVSEIKKSINSADDAELCAVFLKIENAFTDEVFDMVKTTSNILKPFLIFSLLRVGEICKTSSEEMKEAVEHLLTSTTTVVDEI